MFAAFRRDPVRPRDLRQRRHVLRPRGLLPVQLPVGLGGQHLQHRSDARKKRHRLPLVAVETPRMIPLFSVLQPRTARATRVPARTGERASAAATPSPASAGTGGRGRRALRVRDCAWSSFSVSWKPNRSLKLLFSFADVDDCNPHPWYDSHLKPGAFAIAP